MKNKDGNKPTEEAAESIFDMQTDKGIVECGRTGISFDRTFSVLLIRLGDEAPASEGAINALREKARKLWQQGVEVGNVQTAERLKHRFDSDYTGSYTDMEAYRRNQAIDDEIEKQFGSGDAG